MQAQLNDFMMTVFKALLPLLAVGGAWLLARMQSYIAAHTQNTKISGILSRLTSTAAAVVQEVEQTFVSTLQNPTADDLKAAKDKAMAALRSHLGPKGLDEIETVLALDGTTAVDRLLNTTIESAVHDLKMTQASVAASTPVTVVPSPVPAPGGGPT